MVGKAHAHVWSCSSGSAARQRPGNWARPCVVTLEWQRGVNALVDWAANQTGQDQAQPWVLDIAEEGMVAFLAAAAAASSRFLTTIPASLRRQSWHQRERHKGHSSSSRNKFCPGFTTKKSKQAALPLCAQLQAAPFAMCSTTKHPPATLRRGTAASLRIQYCLCCGHCCCPRVSKARPAQPSVGQVVKVDA